MPISSVELNLARSKIARGAGNVVYVMGVENKYAQVKNAIGED